MSSQNNGREGAPQPDEKGDNVQGSNAPRPEPELPRWATKASVGAPFGETRMVAFIGPKWEKYYRAKLARFIAEPAFTPTWNWAAAFGNPFWFLYRKLYFPFLLFFTAPVFLAQYVVTSPDALTVESMLAGKPSPDFLALLGLTLSGFIAAGGTANWFLFRRARAASIVVSLQQLPEQAALSWLRKNGGVSVLPTVLFVLFVTVFPVAMAMLGLGAK